MNSGLNVARTPFDAAGDVGGHDHDGVLEVHRAALAVGEPAVVHQLEEHVEHVDVCLLELVEQHHRVRPPAHRLGELAALVVTHVAGRRAHEARHGVLLHVLRHVDPDHGLLGVEHELGQRAGQLRLADAGGTDEQERADRPVGVLEAGAGTAQGVGDGLHRLVLADHAIVEALLHVDELGHLALHQLRDRDPRPLGHDLGHVLVVDLLLEEGHVGLNAVEAGLLV